MIKRLCETLSFMLNPDEELSKNLNPLQMHYDSVVSPRQPNPPTSSRSGLKACGPRTGEACGPIGGLGGPRRSNPGSLPLLQLYSFHRCEYDLRVYVCPSVRMMG